MAKCNQLTYLPFKGLMRSFASVCRVHTVIFERIDLDTSVLVCRYVFRISRSKSSYIKVIGSRSRSQEQKNGIYDGSYNTFAS